MKIPKTLIGKGLNSEEIFELGEETVEHTGFVDRSLNWVCLRDTIKTESKEEI